VLINRRGVAVALVSGALVVGGLDFARGPSYLSNPVVTATVQSCLGTGSGRYCAGTWPAGNGATHHGGIEGDTRLHVGDQVKVRAKDDSSVTTVLNLTAVEWVFRELVAALFVAGGIALGVLLYQRRKRYIAENPDQLPGLVTAGSK
jgi:hypothetical protein